ncbi:MAG: L-threonylcarbamoyladenylate synthase [Candidatus Omnitrophota bacterium]|nr:L-threonylcarbamoyladenylate synthase [Candidatus Omnitrophota bacterium]
MKTQIIKIDPQNPEPGKISYCAKILRQGGLVAFPTETVYGLAANLSHKKAVERLNSVKKRTEGKPFSVHIAEKEKIEKYAMNLTPLVYKLIDKFWPGPLTLILPSPEGGTVGIRMPKNPIALRFIYEAGVPIVAPSANISGNSPPKNIDQVLKDLNGLIDLAIDGGPTELGLESTILDLTIEPPKILRKGAIDEKEIKKIIKNKTLLFVCTGNSCRSVMAQALLKKMLEERDDVEVLSAGTNAMMGMSVSASTQELLLKEDIDVSSRTAQMVSEMMLKKADLILVMEKTQENKILEKHPSVKNRLYLLKEFAGIEGSDLNIPDPIGSSEEVYQEVFNLIKEAVGKIAAMI